MTSDEAREVTDEIKAGLDRLFDWLVESYRRRDWATLGYLSFRLMINAEFDGPEKVLAVGMIPAVEQANPDIDGGFLRPKKQAAPRDPALGPITLERALKRCVPKDLSAKQRRVVVEATMTMYEVIVDSVRSSTGHSTEKHVSP